MTFETSNIYNTSNTKNERLEEKVAKLSMELNQKSQMNSAQTNQEIEIILVKLRNKEQIIS